MSDIKESGLERKIFLSFVRVHILYHAVNEDIFGIELIEDLKRHEYKISPGTLYPILHKLEKDGYLSSRTENVAGKIRRYYRATEKGNSLLIKAKEKIRELFHEIIEV